jgi:hypothetical protein
MKIDQLNNTLSVLSIVTGVHPDDATVQIGDVKFTLGQLTSGVPIAAGLTPKTGTGKRGRKPGSKNKVVKAPKAVKPAKPAKGAKRKASPASAASDGKRSVGKPVSPEGLHRRELIMSAIQGAAGPMALGACVRAVLPGIEKFIVDAGGKWDDTVSTTQNQLIRYDLKGMTERGVLVKSGSGRDTTYRVKAA